MHVDKVNEKIDKAKVLFQTNLKKLLNSNLQLAFEDNKNQIEDLNNKKISNIQLFNEIFYQITANTKQIVEFEHIQNVSGILSGCSTPQE